MLLRLPLPVEERLLNKLNTIRQIKASFTACLFLFCLMATAQPTYEWIPPGKLYEAYELTCTVQIHESRKRLSQESSPEQLYIHSLNDVLELLLTEDETAFEKYGDAFETRLGNLEKSPGTGAALFVMAELRLQWAFVYLKLGHELDAAWNIRQSYLLVQECKAKYPDFYPIKKTSGVLEVMLGSVPEKYQWVLSLFGMQGSTEKGLSELKEVMDKSKSLHFEATLLYYLIQGFMLQNTAAAVQGLHHELQGYSNNRLALFFEGTLAIKNSQSEYALALFKQVEKNENGLPISYTHYQLGEIYLHKGEYDHAIQSYQKFLKEYHGQNFVKDAFYKTGICYALKGDKQKALSYFSKAKEAGKESAEADKNAARNVAENYFPNIKLSKIRYATDGGYYEDAKKIAGQVTSRDLLSPKESIEFTYRKARLADKMGDVTTASQLYKETIEQQKGESWYFAPNACLQLGYIAISQNKKSDAVFYFEKALSYKKHEYKNSIDSKAKSALANLKNL